MIKSGHIPHSLYNFYIHYTIFTCHTINQTCTSHINENKVFHVVVTYDVIASYLLLGSADYLSLENKDLLLADV